MTTILILIGFIILIIILISPKSNERKINATDINHFSVPVDIKIDTYEYDHYRHLGIKGDTSRLSNGIYLAIPPDRVKSISLNQIAKHFKCLPKDTREIFFKKLRTFKLEYILKKVSENVYNKQKKEQAYRLLIEPEDTPAAFMEKWMIEYIKKEEYSYRIRTRFEIYEDIMALYPEYGKIVKLGNKELEKKYLNENPFMIDVIMKELAYIDEPAEKCRLKAIEVMSENDNYEEAFYFLNKGLQFDELNTKPFIYSLKAECHKNLSNFEEASKNIDEAIRLMLKNFPKNYYQISELYKKGAIIKEKKGETTVANDYRELCDIFYSEYQANKPLEENDLPF